MLVNISFGSQLRFRLRTGTTTTSLETADYTVTEGQWIHVAAVYDGSNMTIYKDGVQAASTAKTGSITNGNAHVAFGNQPAGAGARAFDGLLDEVCLYDKALSVAEISGNMTTGCGGSGNPPTPTPTANPGTTVDVYLAGTSGEETAELLINDQVAATFTGVGTGYHSGQFIQFTYQHSTALNANQVKVRLVNGGLASDGTTDMNLRVDKIILNGVDYPSEAATTYSVGSWSSSNGCGPGYKQNERLHCTGGYFWYEANVTPPPTATPSPTPTAAATASPTPPPTNEVTTIQRTYYAIAGQAVGVRVKKVLDNGSTESDKFYYMYTDHLGNVGALSDKNGNYITDSLTLFRPFGDFRRVPSTNPDITDRAFTGHKNNNTGDNDLGLIYMEARFYLPNTNRFLSPDPIVPNP